MVIGFGFDLLGFASVDTLPFLAVSVLLLLQIDFSPHLINFSFT